MFGFGSSKNSSNRVETKKIVKNYPQLGLLDVQNFNQIDNIDDDNDDNDEDLEAELLALTGGVPKSPKPAKRIVNERELDKMIKESLRDVPSDDDTSSGEDDPNLLAELEELQVGSVDLDKETAIKIDHEISSTQCVLLERLKMYETAEQNARNGNDPSKTRRMARGIALLRDLIKKIDTGHCIKEEDIPPPVTVNLLKSETPEKFHHILSNENIRENSSSAVLENITVNSPPVPPRVSNHCFSVKENVRDEPEIKMKPKMIQDDQLNDLPGLKHVSLTQDINVIIERQEQYKKAALEAKKNGDVQTALGYVKIVKQFDTLINKINEGAVIDVSSLPPLLQETSVAFKKSLLSSGKQDIIQLKSSLPEAHNIPEIQQNTSSIVETHVAPKTILEALEQRLKRYEDSEEAAKKENNSSKIRRMGRIVQQYRDAIKLHKAGKPIPIDELPTPPGFGSIPGDIPLKPILVSQRQEPTAVSPRTIAEEEIPQPAQALSKNEKRRTYNQLTRNEQQLQVVLEKQKLFKQAALKAKQNGNIELAKEYLKIAKGFDPMIEASRCGLPVDLTSLPLSPEEKKSVESDYEVVRLNDCIQGTDLDVYRKLMTDLEYQIEMCIKTRDHFKAMGDIAGANRLDQLMLRTEKDLRFVQLVDMNNLRVPKFHYETKPFTIVQCNTDLTDNEVEVLVVQGINYNVPNPKEVDTYVKLYFPYPTEMHQQFKSSVIYNTNNPVYDIATKFNIQRNVRACQRIFKRQTLKCEIWSKGGFFKSDSLIGTVNVKLQPLETQCTIHDAFDLMDGRKTVGGKIELKIKLRDPMLRKQIENVEEKWLIIDS